MLSFYVYAFDSWKAQFAQQSIKDLSTFHDIIVLPSLVSLVFIGQREYFANYQNLQQNIFGLAN